MKQTFKKYLIKVLKETYPEYLDENNRLIKDLDFAEIIHINTKITHAINVGILRPISQKYTVTQYIKCYLNKLKSKDTDDTIQEKTSDNNKTVDLPKYIPPIVSKIKDKVDQLIKICCSPEYIEAFKTLQKFVNILKSRNFDKDKDFYKPHSYNASENERSINYAQFANYIRSIQDLFSRTKFAEIRELLSSTKDKVLRHIYADIDFASLFANNGIDNCITEFKNIVAGLENAKKEFETHKNDDYNLVNETARIADSIQKSIITYLETTVKLQDYLKYNFSEFEPSSIFPRGYDYNLDNIRKMSLVPNIYMPALVNFLTQRTPGAPFIYFTRDSNRSSRHARIDKNLGKIPDGYIHLSQICCDEYKKINLGFSIGAEEFLTDRKRAALIEKEKIDQLLNLYYDALDATIKYAEALYNLFINSNLKIINLVDRI